MPLRKLVEGASFAPEDLLVIYSAFDEAWSEIADSYSADLAGAAFAKETMARAIISAAKLEVIEPQQLKTAALEAHHKIKKRDD